MENGVYKINNKTWILDKEHKVQLNIMTISHCGLVGHRRVAATSSMAKDKFIWKNLKGYCEAFV